MHKLCVRILFVCGGGNNIIDFLSEHVHECGALFECEE